MKQREEITYGKGKGKDLIKMSTSKVSKTMAPRRAHHWRWCHLGSAHQNSLSYIIGDIIAWVCTVSTMMSLECNIWVCASHATVLLGCDP
ncbi:hypothetical protein Q3G72_006341 [Acer saccharum]|nr:hypothetical protein Q3G72_006341 [Acer saccharum]